MSLLQSAALWFDQSAQEESDHVFADNAGCEDAATSESSEPNIISKSSELLFVATPTQHVHVEIETKEGNKAIRNNIKVNKKMKITM